MLCAKINQIIVLKSNGFLDERIKFPATSNNILAPGMTFLMVSKSK